MAASTLPSKRSSIPAPELSSPSIHSISPPADTMAALGMRRIASEDWRYGPMPLRASSSTSALTTPTLGASDARNGSAERYLEKRRHVLPYSHEYGSEILQDGLGSDELIPHDWATGSRAKFTSQSTSALHAARKPRLRSPSPPQCYAGAGGEEHLSHMPRTTSSLRPLSSQRSTPLLSIITTQRPECSVEQARERARRLARERQSSASQRSASAGFQQDLQQDERQARAGEMSDANGATAAPRLNGSAADTSRSQGEMERASAHTNGAATVPPLQISKRQNGYTAERRAPSGATKDRSDKSFLRGGQDSTQPSSIASASASTSNAGQEPAILDEFGPLGGQPKDTSTVVNDTDEFGSRRVVSNPWDEEYIPTVKRRMEQERLLGQVGRSIDSDVLYDTWDRNGLPLRERHVSVLQHNGQREQQQQRQHAEMATQEVMARDDAARSRDTTPNTTPRKASSRAGASMGENGHAQRSEQDVTRVEKGSPGRVRVPSHEAQRSQAEERLRRLTTELEVGLRSSMSGSFSANDGPSVEDKIAAERAALRSDQLRAHRGTGGTKTTRSPGVEHPFPSPMFPPVEKQKPEPRPEPKAPLKNKKAVQDDAGCCKCIIM